VYPPLNDKRASAEGERQLAILLLGALLFAFGYTSLVVLVPLRAIELGAPVAELGMVLTVPGFLAVFGSLPSAAISNRYGRASLVRAGLSVLFLGTLAYLPAPTLVWMIPGQLTIGLAASLFWPSAVASIVEVRSRRTQEARQGGNVLLQGLGSLLGAAVAGVVVSSLGTGAAFAVVAVVAGVGLTTCLVLKESIPSSARTRTVQFRATARSGLAALMSSRPLAAAQLLMIPWSMLWWVAGTSFFVLYARENNHTAAFAGILLAMRFGTASILRLGFARISQHVGLAKLAVLGNLIAGLALACAALDPGAPMLIASALVQGAGLALVVPAVNVLIAGGSTPRERATGFALTTSLANAALLISPTLLAAVVSIGGSGAAILAAGSFAALASLGLALFLRERRPPVRPDGALGWA
jgi:MFS family permease